jgi:hypothetical protein
MQLPQRKRLAVFLLFFALRSLPTALYADPSAEALCEKLHIEALKKAKQALTAGNTNDAVRFLQEAAAIAERCASLPEPSPRGRAEEKVLSSAALSIRL